MLNELFKLYELGFALHWLNKRSKVPVENKWSTRERKTFEELRQSYTPGYNVGVRPGLVSKLNEGFFLGIIDCDMKSEEPVHLKEMEKALDSIFPDWYISPQVVSGRNKLSRHIYVKVSELFITGKYQIAESSHKVKYLAPSKKEISKYERENLSAEELDKGIRLAKAWEITFMGDGSQVAIPPSIHPDSGRKYTWGIAPTSKDDFLPFEPRREKAKLSKAVAMDFELLDDVPVYELPLSERIIELIYEAEDKEGRYHSDRSAMLMACINAMVGKNISDQVIVSVLTDSSNAISEKALEKGSRGAAAKWVYAQVVKARSELDVALAFDEGFEVIENELTPGEAIEQDEAAIAWWDTLERNKTDNKPKNTQRNRDLILTKGLLPNTFRFNSFSNQVEFGAEPPWALSGKEYLSQEIDHVDIIHCKSWLSAKWKIEVGSSDLWEAIQGIARKFHYHPVRDYLSALAWDGVPRLETWLKTYLNAEGDARYLRAVGVKTLVAAVARVFVPGVKFDNVVVFEGGQGVGKSSAIKILGGKWATDAYIDPNNKDTINTIQGNWLIEMAEMVQAHKSEAESLKAFISKTEDRARLAFEKKAQSYPRQCIFIGTTNQDEYLQDETGNRRFWPVKVGELMRSELVKDRDQIWAEAVHCFKAGEELWLEDADIRALAGEQQAVRVIGDSWTDDIQEYLLKNADKDFFVLKDIFSHICGMDGFEMGSRNFTMGEQKRIGKILKTLGYERIQKKIEGINTKVWVHISQGVVW